MVINQRRSAITKYVFLGMATASLTFFTSLALTYSLAHPYRAAMETVLRGDLLVMRRAIDQYLADRGELPRSFDDLIQKGYLSELPTDAITGKREWKIIEGETEMEGKMIKGMVDVRSNAEGNGTNGRSYSEY